MVTHTMKKCCIFRELLHLKYFGTPLNEVGPCTLKADGSSPEPEPEGEPESEPYAEPEPRNPRRRPVAEPEAEPRNGRLRTEPVPEPEKLSPEPESAPAKLSPESQLELIQILELLMVQSKPLLLQTILVLILTFSYAKIHNYLELLA